MTRTPSWLARQTLTLGLALGCLGHSTLVGQSEPPASPTPLQRFEARFGFRPGSEGRLIGPVELASIGAWLAAKSPHFQRQSPSLGEGLPPMELWFLSTADLEAVAQRGRERHDPRLLGEGSPSRAKPTPPSVLLAAGIHAAEVGATLSTVTLAVELALAAPGSEHRQLLRKCTVIMIPAQDPNTLQALAKHWARHSDDPAARTRALSSLQHPIGRDLNRDWFALTRPETRATVLAIHRRFRPLLSIDLHQMPGRDARGWPKARSFVPPYARPFDPHRPAGVERRTAELGAAVLGAATKAGLSGIETSRGFDAWSPSRSLHPGFGGVRFLIEIAASDPFDPERPLRPPRARLSLAGPDHPLPWSGGRWTLADATERSHTLALLTLHAFAERAAAWAEAHEQEQRRLLETGPASLPDIAGLRVHHQPFAAGAQRRLLDLCAVAGIEVATTPILGAPDSAARLGPPFHPLSAAIIPPGTELWLSLRQPGGAWLASLFGDHPYPAHAGPAYDTTSHRLDHHLGLRVSRQAQPPTELRPLTLPAPSVLLTRPLPHALRSSRAIIDARHDRAALTVFEALQQGHRVQHLLASSRHPQGAFLLSAGPAATLAIRWPIARQRAVDFPADPPEGLPLQLPKLHLFAPTPASPAALHLAAALRHMALPFQPARALPQLQRPVSNSPDSSVGRVLLLPDATRAELSAPQSRGGLGRKAPEALRRFVHQGGHIIASGRSLAPLIDWLDLPVRLVPRAPGEPDALRAEGAFAVAALTPPSLQPAGSLAGSKGSSGPAGTPTKTSGLHESTLKPIHLWRPRPFRPRPSAAPQRATLVPILTVPNRPTVASGRIRGAPRLANALLAAQLALGRGQITLFASPPHFRRWSEGSAPLLWDALLRGARR